MLGDNVARRVKNGDEVLEYALAAVLVPHSRQQVDVPVGIDRQVVMRVAAPGPEQLRVAVEPYESFSREDREQSAVGEQMHTSPVLSVHLVGALAPDGLEIARPAMNDAPFHVDQVRLGRVTGVKEVEAVRDIFGEGTVLTGFYSYGEISPFTPTGPCALHNQTMTITTISEKPRAA